MSSSILICGVGGQGTVLAAKVLAQAALSRGEPVLSAETIGMAQRGGSVTSHVRIGADVHSPLVPTGGADVLIAFEAAEAVRNAAYLKKTGTVIVNSSVVQPVTASLTGKLFAVQDMLAYLHRVAARVIAVDAAAACAQLGSAKVVNMLLLGAACKAGLFSLPEVQAAVQRLVKPQFHALNMRALRYAESAP